MFKGSGLRSWRYPQCSDAFEVSESLEKLTQPLVIGDRSLACANVVLRGNIFWNNASFRLPIIPGTGINRHLCSVTFEFTEAWPRASIPQLPGAISLKMELRSMFNRVMFRKIVVNYATCYDFVNIPVFFSFMYDATSTSWNACLVAILLGCTSFKELRCVRMILLIREIWEQHFANWQI